MILWGYIEADWFAKAGKDCVEMVDLMYFLEQVFLPPAVAYTYHLNPILL